MALANKTVLSLYCEFITTTLIICAEVLCRASKLHFIPPMTGHKYLNGIFKFHPAKRPYSALIHDTPIPRPISRTIAQTLHSAISLPSVNCDSSSRTVNGIAKSSAWPILLWPNVDA